MLYSPPLNHLVGTENEAANNAEAIGTDTQLEEQSITAQANGETVETALELLPKEATPGPLTAVPLPAHTIPSMVTVPAKPEITAVSVAKEQSDVSNAELYLEQLAAEVTNVSTPPTIPSPVGAASGVESESLVQPSQSEADVASRKRKRLVAADFDESTNDKAQGPHKIAKEAGTFGSTAPANIVIDLSDGEDEGNHEIKDRRSLKKKLQEKLRDMAALKREVMMMQQRRQNSSETETQQHALQGTTTSGDKPAEIVDEKNSVLHGARPVSSSVEIPVAIPGLQQLQKLPPNSQTSQEIQLTKLQAEKQLLEERLKESLRGKHKAKASPGAAAAKNVSITNPIDLRTEPFPEVLRKQHTHLENTAYAHAPTHIETASSSSNLINAFVESQNPSARLDSAFTPLGAATPSGPFVARLIQYYQQMSKIEVNQRMIDTQMHWKRNAMSHMKSGLYRLERAQMEVASAKADIDACQATVNDSNMAVKKITETLTQQLNILKPNFESLLRDKEAEINYYKDADLSNFQLAVESFEELKSVTETLRSQWNNLEEQYTTMLSNGTRVHFSKSISNQNIEPSRHKMDLDEPEPPHFSFLPSTAVHNQPQPLLEVPNFSAPIELAATSPPTDTDANLHPDETTINRRETDSLTVTHASEELHESEAPSVEESQLSPSLSYNQSEVNDTSPPESNTSNEQTRTLSGYETLIDGKRHTPAAFAAYKSPLYYFRSYRFHPKFLDLVTDGYRSLTHSLILDPQRVLCKYETAGGTCNDESCTALHFRDLTVYG